MQSSDLLTSEKSATESATWHRQTDGTSRDRAAEENTSRFEAGTEGSRLGIGQGREADVSSRNITEEKA